MEQNTLLQAARMMYDQVRKKRWHKVVSCLAAVVVFCTTYALILPAITMTEEYICGYAEEHTHDESCFEMQVPLPTLECSFDGSGADIVLHTHDEQCEAAGCVLAENVAHAHSPECYVTHEEVVCGFEEAHLHSDACYVSTRTDELICTLVEGEGHTHADGCYDENGVLVCAEAEQEAHAHSDECYVWEKSLTCTLEEDPNGHFHVDGCFEYREELVCDADEVIPHEHDDSCYAEGALICEKPVVVRHQHGSECYIEPENTEPVKVLTCQLEEHVHDENCYPAEDIYYCGYAEHEHGDACHSADGSLICEQEAHTHDESCMTEPELSAVERVRAIIEALPDIEDVEARTLELEEAEDMEGLEAYWYEVGMQGRVAYEAYMELSEEDQAVLDEDTELMNRLENLKPYWSRVTLEVTDTVIVKNINVYNSDSGFYSPVLVYGGSVDEVIGDDFFYWRAIVVESDEDDNLYIDQIISDISGKFSKAPYKAMTSKGFVLLIWDGFRPIVSAQIGDPIYVDFDYTKLQGYSSTGYGTVTFGSNDSDPVSVVTKTQANDPVVSTSEFVELNIYDYYGDKSASAAGKKDINTKHGGNEEYPGFQWNGGAYMLLEDNTYTSADESVFSRSRVDNIDFGNSIITDYSYGATYYSDNRVSSTYTGKTKIGRQGGAINEIIQGSDGNWANLPAGITSDYDAMLHTQLNGYPALADGTTSLVDLFSESNYASKKNNVSIDGLFRQNQETGEFWFDSRENHAYYSNNKFTLYNQIITPNFILYPFGNFLPFNEIEDFNDVMQVTQIDDLVGSSGYMANIQTVLDKANVTQHQLYDMLKRYRTAAGGGNAYSAEDALVDYFEGSSEFKNDYDYEAFFNSAEGQDLLNRLYNIDFDVEKNFLFGMDMEMNFLMPKDGKTGNDTDGDGKPDYDMVFYFAGDDDVWVYIDDILFLDLTGIHRHVGGEIDFVNGIVKYYAMDSYINGAVESSPYYTMTFADILKKHGGVAESDLDKYLEKDASGNYTTFKNYSTHKFNFYYMERGTGSSVCRINFNFPLLKQNSINVAKELSVDDESKLESLGNPDFSFQILKADGNGNKTDDLFIGGGVEYIIYDNANTKVGTGTTDADGIVRIKAGQRAEFDGIDENSGKYYVRELLDTDYFAQYGTVSVDGNSITTSNEVTIGSDTFNGLDSPVKDMSDGTTVFHFNNQIAFNKLGSLSITKELTEYPMARNTPSFDFYVEIDGEPVPVGTNYGIETVKSAGIITVPAGSTAVIENIIAGSRYTVVEMAESSAGYDVEYDGTGSWNEEIGAYEGVIAVDTAVNVKVTNSEIGTEVEIPVSKTLLSTDGQAHTFKFDLLEVDENGTAVEGGHKDEIILTVDAEGKASGSFRIVYLKKDMADLGDRYYMIYEDDDPATDTVYNDSSTNMIEYDKSKYIVKVVFGGEGGSSFAASIEGITKDGVEYSMDTDWSLGFVNQQYWFELPETGADGTFIYELGGPIMSFASMASLLYIQIRRKNRAGGSDDPC